MARIPRLNPEVVGQERHPCRRHTLLLDQTSDHVTILRRPIGSGSTRDEPDRPTLVVDALPQVVDPSVSDRSGLELIERHRLLPRALLVDGDDDFLVARTVVTQPGVELGVGGDRNRS